MTHHPKRVRINWRVTGETCPDCAPCHADVMNRKAEQVARDAGFVSRRDSVTTSAASQSEFHGIDLVPSEIMPEGWIGLRTEKGVTLIGPNGQSEFVPFFDPWTRKESR